jgi:hypothetical protein
VADCHRDVKPASVFQPSAAATGATSPGADTQWRATTLERVTEALEQRRILELVGSVDGKRVLDCGCGDGLLTATLATRGAWPWASTSIDGSRTLGGPAADRVALSSATDLRRYRELSDPLISRQANCDAATEEGQDCTLPKNLRRGRSPS